LSRRPQRTSASLDSASPDSTLSQEFKVAALKAELLELRAKVKAQVAMLKAQGSEMQGLLGQPLEEAAAQRRLQSASYVSVVSWEETVENYHMAMDSLWLLLCGALVMLMHAGFSMLEAGCCRVKNTSNVLMKNLVNVCMGTLGWYFFGWAIAYGGPYDSQGLLIGDAFIGSKEFLSDGFVKETSDGMQPSMKMLSWFFQWAFCTAGATIVSGGVAERVKSPSYAVFAFVMAGFIYPCIAAWCWGGGWLSKDIVMGDFHTHTGITDFAGSGVVHVTGGIAALAGTVVLGPRKGRFERPEEFEAHSLPLVVLGTFILWFGWFGFNPGSTLTMHSKEMGAIAAQVAVNTTLSAAAGGITVFSIRYALLRKYDVGGLCNGILVGLVSITAGCATMESGSAICVGLIGSFIYQAASMLLVKLKIDDPVDAIPVHGAGGMWGVIAAVLFDWGEGFDSFHGKNLLKCTPKFDDSTKCSNVGGALVAQIIMLVVIILWSGTLSSTTFLLMRFTGLLRIDEETEELGMDLKMHSPAKAYIMSPQQNPEPPTVPVLDRTSLFV